ncbi:hypothetical protein SLCG_6358 [Streptomyces lincolnensis]|nr:hypothetical protein SLCG_3435 [Streptomyces lincolnensis]AXG57513.1 hypothetical protein SLCG_6358 [Streptomyces lincolnensis]
MSALLYRPIRTRFRYGFPTRVNLATHRKLAGSFFKRHAVTTACASTYSDAPTACRHTVSGTISLRSRGTFHHSLTVLSAIGHQGIFRLSGWSRQIHTGFLGPRATWVSLKRAADVSTTGVLPSTPDLSHVLRLHQRFLTRPVAGRRQKRDPTTPHTQPLPGLTRIRFGLIRFRSPLLPESRLFSLPAGTEMFHFPAFPPHTLCVQVWVTAHDDCRVSPFGNPRIKAWLTTPRGLSWPPTSFIGSWCQGIHRAPLKTWPQMLASTVQFSNNDQPPITPPSWASSLGPAPEDRTLRPCPQTPNSVPDTLSASLNVPRSEEQYWKEKTIKCAE